ncbi:MAG TPA: uroporphyrinogen decarboxylase family protein [Spirochaetota bacterium]|nr:uroporphyrinogen decarboxylase family protein [Spirochaetota bacterium]
MEAAERYRATMNGRQPDRFVRREFGFMEGVLQKWRAQGLKQEPALAFNYDHDPGDVSIEQLGWVDPPLCPAFTEEVLEENSNYTVKRDRAGRVVKFFQGREDGYMPTYLQHAVNNDRDWEEKIVPRLDPDSTERLKAYDAAADKVVKKVKADRSWLTQMIIGQYMYLRALLGPEGIMYVFYDQPALVEKMLVVWLELCDKMISRLQRQTEIDELFFAEDICYNHGLLISPQMWRRFFRDKYLELIRRVQSRQQKRISIEIDTDGYVADAIPLYIEIGMNAMSPFENCSGQDIVEIGRRYPKLVIKGGIDKKILAATPAAIDKHLEYIIPFMVKRGRFIPTCDHMVPLEVDLENYRYYRQKIVSLENSCR